MTPQPQSAYPRLEALGLPDALVKGIRTAYDYIYQLRTSLAGTKTTVDGLAAIALAFRSAWVINYPYKPRDIVSHTLGLYIALKDNVNVTPGTDPTVWELMVQGV